MKTQIMIDLETLGNRPGSVILSLGAVKFGEGKILEEFYKRVDIESCVQLGLKMDASTVLWWMNQSDEARHEILRRGNHLSIVLGDFNSWVHDHDAEVWGNGSEFDNVLLSSAYGHAQIALPWSYNNNRCYRTLKNLRRDIPMVRSGTHHNALDDARSQAVHLMEILRVMENERKFAASVPALLSPA